MPTNTVLASTTIPNSAVQSGATLVDGDFADPAVVNAGQQLAVLITRPGAADLSVGERFGDCPNGPFYFSQSQTGPFTSDNPDSDMVFEVFVESTSTRPLTSITKGPKAKTKKRNATFEFTADDVGSSFVCSLDGGPFQPCSSPKTYDKLKRKKHSFAVTATDPSGNVDPSPATFDWKVKKKK